MKLNLNNYISHLSKSSFVRNILIVMSGTAAAQVIGFVLTPIISRLFSPSDFGIFGSFSAILSVIASVVTFDYTQAIMLPRQKEDAINLFFLSCLSTLIVTLGCSIFCFFSPMTVNGIMRTTGPWALALLVIGVLVNGLNLSLSAWSVRSKAFKATSSSQVIRSVSSSGTQIGLGFLKGGAESLIFASILAEILASLNLLCVLFSDIRTLRHDIKWSRMKLLAKEYRDFPLYSASPNLIDALSRGLPVLLLTYFYGIAVAGAYAFSIRIIQAPTALITNSLRQVLFQNASELYNKGGRLLPLYIKITAGLFGLAIFPAFILAFWAPSIFTWIFGSQWHTAGQFARYLVLWLMFMFCNTPALLFSRIIRIQQKMFIWRLAMHTLRIMTLIISGMYLSELQTIMFFSMVGGSMNIFMIFFVGHNLAKTEKNSFQ